MFLRIVFLLASFSIFSHQGFAITVFTPVTGVEVWSNSVIIRGVGENGEKTAVTLELKDPTDNSELFALGQCTKMALLAFSESLKFVIAGAKTNRTAAKFAQCSLDK